MCGIVGLFDVSGLERARLDTLRAMSASLAHRGPDAAGEWVDLDAGIAMAHRRLSIVELSALGAQPMTSSGGRFVIVLNGEIYNFRTVRRDLEQVGRTFRGHSDTEVVAEAFECWGPRAALERFVGMFAIAAWDVVHRDLLLIRDRIGEKPLYYARAGSEVIFGSELKAVRLHPRFRAELDPSALADLLATGYIPSPRSIYANAMKVPPATMLRFSRDGAIVAEEYWSLASSVSRGVASRRARTPGDMREELRTVLSTTLDDQVFADVPVGAFLSGGIDSSLIVALIQAKRTQQVRTFSIGVADSFYDEAPAARAIARHLGTQHTEHYFSADDALSLVSRLPDIYDEPFADSSQLPTFFVSQLARRSVTVALSGDGGDELFGGYERYWKGRSLLRSLARVPLRIRQQLAARILAVPPDDIRRKLGGIARLLPSSLGGPKVGHRLRTLAKLLTCTDAAGAFEVISSPGAAAQELLLAPGIAGEQFRSAGARLPDGLGTAEAFEFLDMLTYLPDDIMAKVDRASMAVSLETRAPFLDHRVIEWSWSLSEDDKLRSNRGKLPLRDLLSEYVPPALVAGPKRGFGVPVARWLRGPLKEWASDILAESSVRAGGVLNPVAVTRLWQAHLDGADWQNRLWPVLMFEQWRMHQKTHDNS